MSSFGKTDREIRLECVKLAAGLTMQLKMPQTSVIGVARQLYDFVTEEKTEAESERLGEVRKIG